MGYVNAMVSFSFTFFLKKHKLENLFLRTYSNNSSCVCFRVQSLNIQNDFNIFFSFILVLIHILIIHNNINVLNTKTWMLAYQMHDHI